MAPCSGNVITPKMIRTGQVHIGDKIEFEKEGNVLVSSPDITSEEILVSSQNFSPAEEIPDVQTPEAASDNVNHVQMVSTSNLEVQPEEKTRGSIAEEKVVPTATAFSEENPHAADTVGNSMPSAAGTGNDNGVSLRRQQPQSAGNYSQTSNQTAAQAGYNNMISTNTAQIPLAFQQMTDYVNSLENNGTQSPTFNVPSNPLVPPGYEQTIDYDSMQYMNGFLRTQIGRYMRVEQLIGGGISEDRYGFLVGVGNNYLLLQDISNGNVSLVDIYTVKYVHIYFEDPIFPNLSFGNPRKQ